MTRVQRTWIRNGDNLKTNRNEHRHLSTSLQEAQCQEETLQNEKEGFELRQQEECEQSKQAGVVRSGTHYSDEQSIGHQFVHGRSLPDEMNDASAGASSKFEQQRFNVVACTLAQRRKGAIQERVKNFHLCLYLVICFLEFCWTPKVPRSERFFFGEDEVGDKIELVKGQELKLVTDNSFLSDSTCIAVSYPKLPTSVKLGGIILCADGSLSLSVRSRC